jgi:branched-chain amino acid aminotransferase
VRDVDGRQVGIGSRGPITELLQHEYFETVQGRRDEQYGHWLTYYDVG